MAASATGDAVYVEGRDDEYVIRHLLIRRGVDPECLPEFVEMDSDQGDQVRADMVSDHVSVRLR